MFFQRYLVTLPIFFIIDMIWLGVVSNNLYKEQLGFLMKPSINWPAGIIFYLLFIVGLVIFVISPSLEKNSLSNALILGGLFGLIAYSTYDLTNLATIKNWPVLITVIDMIWGTILSSSVCGISYYILSRLK